MSSTYFVDSIYVINTTGVTHLKVMSNVFTESAFSSSMTLCLQDNVKSARTSTQCSQLCRVLVMEQCLDSEYLGRNSQVNISAYSVTCKI